jgi:hypothetical protein
LFELERKQNELDEDLKGDLTAKKYARAWYTSDKSGCMERWGLLAMSRAKIKEYGE